jgi:Diadenosine tetraphosphate (Ap4A) hydrolase and other HIT family hydrolases
MTEQPDTMQVPGCPLCGEHLGTILYASKFAFCLPAAEPLRPGHLLVISRRHVTKLTQLSAEELAGLMETLSVVTLAAEEVTGADKLYVLHVGDKISHYHFHLIPYQATDTPLGPFVFDDSGWKSAQYAGSVADHRTICDCLRLALGVPERSSPSGTSRLTSR